MSYWSCNVLLFPLFSPFIVHLCVLFFSGQFTIGRAWRWGSVWAGWSLGWASQRAKSRTWADSGLTARSAPHPPAAARPGPECTWPSTGRTCYPVRKRGKGKRELKMKKRRLIRIKYSVAAGLSAIVALPTSCCSSLRDAAAWWRGLHVHKVSASLHRRPPCKSHQENIQKGVSQETKPFR